MGVRSNLTANSDVLIPPRNAVYARHPAIRWTADRYRRAIASGVFGEDEPLELLFGTITEKMSANPPHEACVNLLEEYFTERFFKQYGLRSESGILLSDESVPQPDFAVVRYRKDHYVREHPQPAEIFLLIEVADSSIYVDRQSKALAYAKAGIPEYWIINIRARQVELYLQPDLEQETYKQVTHFREGEQFDSPFVGSVAVADLLPDSVPPG